LKHQLEKKSNFETFVNEAPKLNPNASKITGTICGYRVEEIEDKLIQKVRYLTKLINAICQKYCSRYIVKPFTAVAHEI
jgi:hypothetical protein